MSKDTPEDTLVRHDRQFQTLKINKRSLDEMNTQTL